MIHMPDYRKLCILKEILWDEYIHDSQTTEITWHKWAKQTKGLTIEIPYLIFRDKKKELLFRLKYAQYI